MAVKYLDGSQMKIRFTDYKLDGAANTWYFYYAAEMNSKFEVSDRSPVSGPISLVNTIPAEPPAIKEIISTPADILLMKGPRVNFKVNPFIENENIKRLRIYRTTDYRKATSVRNMVLAKELAVDESLMDDFSDLTDLPYTEPLYYRLVALREITNEQGVTEYVPSKPSEISMSNIIDQINPPAPEVSFSSDPLITNIALSWQKTVHNGKYTLFKMNASGNWTKMHEIKTNDTNIQVQLSDTAWDNADLEKLDDSNQAIFHHFKVVAINSSNLLSMEDKVLTI
jgi:hypothetical protein